MRRPLRCLCVTDNHTHAPQRPVLHGNGPRVWVRQIARAAAITVRSCCVESVGRWSVARFGRPSRPSTNGAFVSPLAYLCRGDPLGHKMRMVCARIVRVPRSVRGRRMSFVNFTGSAAPALRPGARHRGRTRIPGSNAACDRTYPVHARRRVHPPHSGACVSSCMKYPRIASATSRCVYWSGRPRSRSGSSAILGTRHRGAPTTGATRTAPSSAAYGNAVSA